MITKFESRIQKSTNPKRKRKSNEIYSVASMSANQRMKPKRSDGQEMNFSHENLNESKQKRKILYGFLTPLGALFRLSHPWADVGCAEYESRIIRTDWIFIQSKLTHLVSSVRLTRFLIRQTLTQISSVVSLVASLVDALADEHEIILED